MRSAILASCSEAAAMRAMLSVNDWVSVSVRGRFEGNTCCFATGETTCSSSGNITFPSSSYSSSPSSVLSDVLLGALLIITPLEKSGRSSSSPESSTGNTSSHLYSRGGRSKAVNTNITTSVPIPIVNNKLP